MKFISIIYSFRNEAENIPELIKRTIKSLESIPISYEIIFVNDYSNDNSLQILKAFHQKNPKIKIINMSRNFGGTPSILAGFKYATGDALIYLDSDLQDPPELFPKLIKKWEEGYDVVHTTRKKRKGENLIKMLLTRIAYKIIKSMANINIRKDSGDFKLLSRRAIDNILDLAEYDPFLRGMSSWIGFNQTEVFYDREPRFLGKTKFSLWNFGTNPYQEFLRGILSFSNYPLYISFFLGMLLLTYSFFHITFLGYHYLINNIEFQIIPLLILTNMILTGLILFVLGLLGFYIGSIHREIRKRPKYIIESFIGFNRNEN